MDGYIFNVVNGNLTNNCIQCAANCYTCENLTSCQSCKSGYYLTRENGNGRCSKCPANCASCRSSQNCEYCEDGYQLVDSSKCVKCADNCDECQNATFCRYCNRGYGIIYDKGVSTGKCGPCSSNCFECSISGECDLCEEDYCLDTLPNSPNYNKCVPCNSDVQCLVENCLVCITGFSDQCAQCNPPFALDISNKCVKPVDPFEPTPTPQPKKIKPAYDKIQDDGNLPQNFDDEEISENSQQLRLTLNYEENVDENNKIITAVTITNTKNRNVAIEIPDGYDEITLKVDSNTNNKEFDIITTKSSIKINLDPSTRASIVEGHDNIRIESTSPTSTVNLNQVEPISALTITPLSPIEINQLEFKEQEGELIINSDNNKDVQINSIKIQQGISGLIQNATIKGKVVIGISSSLEINENVNLESSTLDCSYSDSTSQLLDGAHIKGKLRSVPSSIVINKRNVGATLEQETILIADSYDDNFNCDAWGGKIDKKHFNYECKYVNSRKNLLAIKKDDDDSKGSKLGAGAIAGIVIAAVVVVGAIVFVLVYFLVIKKRKEAQSSVNEAAPEGDKDANEV